MVEVDPAATVVGPAGETAFVDTFEGRRTLVGYFHMWHDGQPWEGQCEGCTAITWQLQPTTPYLNARDATLAVFTEGDFTESSPYAEWLGHRTPWYSARGSSVVAGRSFGFLACFLRTDEGRVFETYWSTDRGTEAMLTHYMLLDRTVFGHQEPWEDSPTGWPRIPSGQHQWRVDGRPVAQWEHTGAGELEERQAPGSRDDHPVQGASRQQVTHLRGGEPQPGGGLVDGERGGEQLPGACPGPDGGAVGRCRHRVIQRPGLPQRRELGGGQGLRCTGHVTAGCRSRGSVQSRGW